MVGEGEREALNSGSVWLGNFFSCLTFNHPPTSQTDGDLPPFLCLQVFVSKDVAKGLGFCSAPEAVEGLRRHVKPG